VAVYWATWAKVDDDGRGLVLAYNEANREVSVVAPQLPLPQVLDGDVPWEDLIAEHAADADFQADDAALRLDV
jgi:hypothetical protein